MHKHHNIPKSRGGTDDDWNMRELSPYDHAYEHALDFVLFEKAPWFDCRQLGWKMLPEDLRDAVRKEIGRRNALPERSDKVRQALTGRVRPQHERDAVSRGLTGQVFTKERCQNISEALTGKKLSEEHKASVQRSKLGVSRPSAKVTCPHCGKVGIKRGMTQWHFDNCKHKEN